ncbi:MAG TPA: uracil-DNA glycosylase [Candidatus Acidoferrum sp.]|jgi:DNA polymerase
MAERISEALRDKLSARLSFYDDIGIKLFYRERGGGEAYGFSQGAVSASPTQGAEQLSSADVTPSSFGSSDAAAVTLFPEDTNLPKIARKPEPIKSASAIPPRVVDTNALPISPKSSIFESAPKFAGDTLPKIQSDLGECTRCKLHTTRNKIVFGDGNPKAELMFIGEGPGHDEDMQGLPFVGRAGKLLTQMIDAMGLKRADVYIANVVKCRPPQNRAPERDEVAACSPFLMRQIDAIAPKVIVCLGSVAAQTLLETTRGISQFRGQWLEFRGRKLMATYHPAYLLRNPPAKSEVWKDLQKVMAVLGLEVRKGKPS